MDLSKKTQENVEFMIKEIINKLQVANATALNPKSFFTEQYDDLRDIHQLVMSKDSFSVSELNAIVSELGQLRK